MLSASSPPASPTTSAASSVKPPTNRDRVRKSVWSRGGRRLYDQAMAPRMVCSRAGRSCGPPVSRGNRWSSFSKSDAGGKCVMRVAANSMASGKPSNRWQTAATATAFCVRQDEIGSGRLRSGHEEADCRGGRHLGHRRLRRRTEATPAAARGSRAPRRDAAPIGSWPGSSDVDRRRAAWPDAGRHRAPAPGCPAPAASGAGAGCRSAVPSADGCPCLAGRAHERSSGRRGWGPGLWLGE